MQKILICDDDSTMLVIYKFIFKDTGLDIITVSNSSVLTSMAKQHLPSLIILDLMMPKKDGATLLRELRGDPATAAIPVLMVSSVMSPEVVANVKELGAREFIEKPFNAGRLREIVGKYVSMPNREKE